MVIDSHIYTHVCGIHETRTLILSLNCSRSNVESTCGFSVPGMEDWSVHFVFGWGDFVSKFYVGRTQIGDLVLGINLWI